MTAPVDMADGAAMDAFLLTACSRGASMDQVAMLRHVRSLAGMYVLLGRARPDASVSLDAGALRMEWRGGDRVVEMTLCPSGELEWSAHVEGADAATWGGRGADWRDVCEEFCAALARVCGGDGLRDLLDESRRPT